MLLVRPVISQINGWEFEQNRGGQVPLTMTSRWHSSTFGSSLLGILRIMAGRCKLNFQQGDIVIKNFLPLP